MVFSSPLFMFLFLPIILGGYFLIRVDLRNIFLMFASLIFYGWGEPKLVVVMIVSILFNYVFGLLLNLFKKNRIILAFSIFFNLSFLIFFKYVNFLVENINLLKNFFDKDPIYMNPISLPIGISFFTFQALSYVVDVYREICPAQKNPINLALYISLFPQLIAGPIVRYYDIAKQINYRETKLENISYGIQRFVLGLGKKVLIANTVGNIADQIFFIPETELTMMVSWLGIVCYTLQIYFDFSGYSDMAIGLGRIFGFKFLENFNYPYISSSIKEFWRRWHISLSSWFRDYVYIPLGGSRCKAIKAYRNLIVVFFLTGLWHGASWNFVVWGLLHGSFLILERLNYVTNFINKVWKPLRYIYTMLVVMIGWVFFRAETLSYAISYIRSMFHFSNGLINKYYVSLYLDNEVILVLFVGVLGSTPIFTKVYNYLYKKVDLLDIKVIRNSVDCLSVLFFFFIFVLSAMCLASTTYNPFIYFRF